MAGKISSLFHSPELCCLSGMHLQARPDVRRPDLLYAALYFNTITSMVPDPDFGERWKCTECTGHISLAQSSEMPRYDRGIVSGLRQAFQEWKRLHISVEATLLYVCLEERIDSETRIVLNIILDEASSLFQLLGQLSRILLGETTSSGLEYHVSMTEPGEVEWFRDDISAASSPRPVASTLEPRSLEGSEFSSATRVDTRLERHDLWEPRSSDGSELSSATRVDTSLERHDLLELSDPPTSNR